MVDECRWLKRRFKIGKKLLELPAADRLQPRAFLKPIGSDSKTSDGFDIHCGVLDEMHAWAKHHHNLYNVLTTAGGSRRQQIVWMFTTAGDDRSELWISLRQQMYRVLEAVEEEVFRNEHLFAFICQLDPDDKPLECVPGPRETDTPRAKKFFNMMAKANPNFPVTPKRAYLVKGASEAADNPMKANAYDRYHCNRRVAAGEQPFTPKIWKQLEKAAEKMDPVVIGYSRGAYDLGRVHDFAAWAVVWKRDDGNIAIHSRSYTCQERRPELKTQEIEEFIKAGQLIEHPGDAISFKDVREDLFKAHVKYSVDKWAYDPHMAKLMSQDMQDKFGESVVETFYQSEINYNEPCTLTFELFRKRQLRPRPDDCLRWQMRNMTYTPNAKGLVMPDKSIGSEYKIDAGVCVIMAIGLLFFGERPKKKKNFYSNNNLEVG